MIDPLRAGPIRWTALLALAALLLTGTHLAASHADGHGADHCAICTIMRGASPAVTPGPVAPPPAPLIVAHPGERPDPAFPEADPGPSPRAPPRS